MHFHATDLSSDLATWLEGQIRRLFSANCDIEMDAADRSTNDNVVSLIHEAMD